MIVITLEGYNPALVDALFKKARVLERIAEQNIAHADAVKKDPAAPRRGYVGFTTLIADHIEKAAKSNEQIATLIKNPVWDEFCNGLLAKIRDLERKPLGGPKPIDFPAESSEEEEESIFSKFKLGFTDPLAADFDENSDDEGEGYLST